MIGAWIVNHLYSLRPKSSAEFYKVAIIYGAPGTASTERGGECKKILDMYPDIQVVFEHYADWDRLKANQVVSDLLVAQPDIDVVYACASAMAMGSAAAVAEAGKSDQIAVIGFGCVFEELEGIQKGILAASPLRMIDDGGVAIANAFYAHMLGLPVPQVYSGPFIMVDDYDKGIVYFNQSTRLSKPVMGY
jgi:autoinducer 2-binding protein LuxP